MTSNEQGQAELLHGKSEVRCLWVAASASRDLAAPRSVRAAAAAAAAVPHESLHLALAPCLPVVRPAPVARLASLRAAPSVRAVTPHVSRGAAPRPSRRQHGRRHIVAARVYALPQRRLLMLLLLQRPLLLLSQPWCRVQIDRRRRPLRLQRRRGTQPAPQATDCGAVSAEGDVRLGRGGIRGLAVRPRRARASAEELLHEWDGCR